MTVERMVADGIELSEYLREHLHRSKVVLVGHSWGTVMGVMMVKARPDHLRGVRRNRPGRGKGRKGRDPLRRGDGKSARRA